MARRDEMPSGTAILAIVAAVTLLIIFDQGKPAPLTPFGTDLLSGEAGEAPQSWVAPNGGVLQRSVSQRLSQPNGPSGIGLSETQSANIQTRVLGQ